MVLTTVIVFQERSASPLPEFGTVQHRPMYATTSALREILGRGWSSSFKNCCVGLITDWTEVPTLVIFVDVLF